MLFHSSRRSFLISSAFSAAFLRTSEPTDVQSLNIPSGGLQPQAAVDSEGVIHLVYLHGDPAAANVAYARKGPDHREFSSPIRVNDVPGSAIAMGTVRGAHLSIGKAGRVHVAWNGSTSAKPKGPGNSAPMLYTRLNHRGDGFEPQRNVMTTATGLDGGGTVAADSEGNVYVAWHAQGRQTGQSIEGEGHRRVWLARSADDGRTFGAEAPVSPEITGACGCCGMGALVDGQGTLYLLYRSARETVHRDMYLLISRDRGRTFHEVDLHPWQIGACPMSTVSLASGDGKVLLSWETDKQVYFAPIHIRSRKIGNPVPAPGAGRNRKHPAIAVNQRGQILLAWTEGTGWKKGGSLAWQVFDEAGRTVGEAGAMPNLPAWDFAAAVSNKSGFFLLS